MADPRWLQMLRAAVERTDGQAVAEQLGLSRTMISLVLGGKYVGPNGPKPTDRLERAVLAKLDLVDCPHLAREIARPDCDAFHTRPMPKSDPDKLRHWVACGRCPVSKAAAEVADELRRAG